MRPEKTARSATSCPASIRRAATSPRSRSLPREEAAHDFLWRIHKAIPAIGDIGIFNRSHYEDVLVVRVHNLVPRVGLVQSATTKSTTSKTCSRQNNVTILKFFLHISKDEQKRRFQERIDDPGQALEDFRGRFQGTEILGRLHGALTKTRCARCSTENAPWFVIPSNKKWFRNLAVSHIIAETLEEHAHEISAADH